MRLYLLEFSSSFEILLKILFTSFSRILCVEDDILSIEFKNNKLKVITVFPVSRFLVNKDEERKGVVHIRSLFIALHSKLWY